MIRDASLKTIVLRAKLVIHVALIRFYKCQVKWQCIVVGTFTLATGNITATNFQILLLAVVIGGDEFRGAISGA